VPAKTVKEIRNTIGVRASDNLQNANYVLVVEGEEDVTALKAILCFLSEKIKRAMDNHTFIIDKIGGAGNLSYKLLLLKNALCVYHVLLDNDEAGRKAHKKAEESGDLEIKDVTFVNCSGMSNSEFEDCINIDTYKLRIESDYGIRLDVSEFRNSNKWSNRMRSVFQTQGKAWSDSIEAQVKSKVANCIKLNVENSLNPHKRSIIDALVYSLEQMIK
jgi:predicted ATP-dependent endonuclease of OLD family